MYCKNQRYVFNGCQVNSKVNPAMKCGCGEIEFASASQKSQLARLFVEKQDYENCACPEYALKNGTFFNALYMPYRAEDDCCVSVMDAKCLKHPQLAAKTKCQKGGNCNVRMH